VHNDMKIRANARIPVLQCGGSSTVPATWVADELEARDGKLDGRVEEL